MTEHTNPDPDPARPHQHRGHAYRAADDAPICGRPCGGRPCLHEPDQPHACSALLAPHELGFWPDLIHTGTPSPPWPRLDDPPIDQARAAAEALAGWHRHPTWPPGGLRVGIVNLDPAPDPFRVADRFVTELAWTLVVATYESTCDAQYPTGPTHTVVVLAGAPPAPPPPASHDWNPQRMAPIDRRRPMTIHRGVAAAAHTVGLIDPPAARLLVLIGDLGNQPEHHARMVRYQTNALHQRGCGVLWLRTAAPVPPYLAPPEDSTAPESAEPLPGDVLHLDFTEPVPGQELGTAALDAMHRADEPPRRHT